MGRRSDDTGGWMTVAKTPVSVADPVDIGTAMARKGKSGGSEATLI